MNLPIEKVYPKGFCFLCSDDEITGLVECTVLFLHTLMLEVGFVSKNVDEYFLYKKMPDNWRGNSLYTFSYYHKTIPDVFCRVTCVPVYNNLTVYGLLEDETDEKNTVHHKIEVTDLFSDSCDTDSLARNIKDEFCFHVLVLIQERVNFKPSFGLSGLIKDCKHAILEYLDVKNLLCMSRVNSEFYNLAKSQQLWKSLFTRDFSDVLSQEDLSRTADWKRKYRLEYRKRKEVKTPVTRLSQDELFRMGLAAVADPSFYYASSPPLEDDLGEYDIAMNEYFRNEYPHVQDYYNSSPFERILELLRIRRNPFDP